MLLITIFIFVNYSHYLLSFLVLFLLTNFFFLLNLLLCMSSNFLLVVGHCNCQLDFIVSLKSVEVCFGRQLKYL